MSYSALAGNPLLLSLENIRDDGFLSEEDLSGIPEFPAHRVDYTAVTEYKFPRLRQACNNFMQRASSEYRDAFSAFCNQKAYWLDDYALFMALKVDQEDKSWNQWEPELAQRQPRALEAKRVKLADEITFHKYLQFEFSRQWSELKQYANAQGIFIVGDIPIYVAHDSADVWARPENFSLDIRTGEPAMMAGVPPDYFSETGQLWGNPVYNWGQLQKTNFKWWIERFRTMLDYVDYIRIDHFRGFEAFWAVPRGSQNAMRGRWIKARGRAFFETLRQELGDLPVMAEDLGVITPEVEALRDRFDFPGMRVLQFAFGSESDNPFLPFNYVRNSVVYTGTHDNDTTISWFEQANDYEKGNLLSYVGGVSDEGVNWELIRIALSSISNVAILPMQDVIGLGGDARMNFPGKAEGNWEWRYRIEEVNDQMCDRLRHLTKLFGRFPSHR
jgi:4-alpha-glucanotransferase